MQAPDGCLFRAIGVACQALHGHARRWLTHEKGMVASAGRLPGAPSGFADQVHAVLAAIGTSSPQIADALRHDRHAAHGRAPAPGSPGRVR